MKRKQILLTGFMGALGLMFVTRILGINQNIVTIALIFLSATLWLLLGITKLINKYLTNYSFKMTQKYFNLLANIHKAKYKSYFEYNQDKTQAFCKLFTKTCNEFIEISQDKKRNEVLEFSPKQTQLIEKMLNKAKEMKEHEFIADYSL